MGELGAVGGAELAAMDEPHARVGRHDPAVSSCGTVDEDVGVQLWVRRSSLDCPRGGVLPARRDHIRRRRVNDGLLVDPLADHGDVLHRVGERAANGELVRPLDSRPQIG